MNTARPSRKEAMCSAPVLHASSMAPSRPVPWRILVAVGLAEIEPAEIEPGRDRRGVARRLGLGSRPPGRERQEPVAMTHDTTRCLPDDGFAGTLIARVWVPAERGPSVALVTETGVFDLSRAFPTVARPLGERD